jgi:hypothetical protein
MATPPIPTKVDPAPTPTQAATTATPAEAVPTATPLPLIKGDDAQKPPTVAAEVPRITPDQLKAMLSSARNVLVVDTRGQDAYAAAHIRGALNIPYAQVEIGASQLSRSAKIVFYCA